MHRLLIVEGEAEYCSAMFARVLARPSREILFATSVKDALAISIDVDVALIDDDLPDGSGRGMIARLRDACPLAEAIIISGHASIDSASEACRLGAFDFLSHPFDDLARVALTVQRACDRIDLRRAQLRSIAELTRSERRYALAADATAEGLWEWDLVTGETFFSRSWWDILGNPDHSNACRMANWFERIHPDERELVELAISAHLEGRSERFDCEYHMRHADGRYRLIVNRGLAVRDANGKATRIAGKHQDVTALRDAENRLHHDAFHDPLTGLANQAMFRERLVRALRSAQRSQRSSALLFLDLDRFKNVNDSLGHVAGDRLLVAIARRLEQHVRASDTFARMGGDEFAILLEDVGEVGPAIALAQRLLRELARPFDLEGHEVFASTSIGITLSSGQDEPDAVLREADTAMYRAKQSGKARFEVFDAEMHASATSLLQLETDLRHALDRHEFRVYYQPIVKISTKRIVGFEALVRWESPTRGLVSPAVFIPVAEEIGLIVPLGNWVLREACTQLRFWQKGLTASRQLYVTVNVSGKQLSSGDLVAEVRQVISDTGLDPITLKLEITESTIVGDVEAARATLLELRSMKVCLCLDDFGTGHSSLSILHQLPIETIKIDRSFIARLQSSGDSAEFVKTILNLASSLELEVIAEGIERPEQAWLLGEFGCRLGQGYFYSRPVDANAAAALLPKRTRSTNHVSGAAGGGRRAGRYSWPSVIAR